MTDSSSTEAFECRDGKARFFAATGEVLPEGNWMIAGRPQSPAFDLMVGVVARGLQRLAVSGRESQVAGLMVEPVYGVGFYLGGLLTDEQLRTARVNDQYVTIPRFNICGRTLSLVVHAHAENAVTFLNPQGGAIRLH